jgi:hypothetical protein
MLAPPLGKHEDFIKFSEREDSDVSAVAGRIFIEKGSVMGNSTTWPIQRPKYREF